MTYLTVKGFCIMAGTAEKNEACISCCKCSLEYLSAACNRTPLCVDWGRNGWVAYGACHSIALWLPKVRSLNTVLMFVCCLLVPRALVCMLSPCSTCIDHDGDELSALVSALTVTLISFKNQFLLVILYSAFTYWERQNIYFVCANSELLLLKW